LGGRKSRFLCGLGLVFVSQSIAILAKGGLSLCKLHYRFVESSGSQFGVVRFIASHMGSILSSCAPIGSHDRRQVL
jgi:hypothetical protein